MNNCVYQGHLARKRFGQNFLHDSLNIDAIISAINPEPGQAIVEIGPGLGALTKPIVERVDAITVIELDRDLTTRLSKHPFLRTKLKIIQQDAMKVNFAALSIEHGQMLRVFGNLPYNISTPLMFHLFSYIHVISDMHFMLPKEVANRMVACQNSKNYGRLSVMAQYYCNIIPILKVPPTSFLPVPKVDSTVVRLIPYRTTSLPVRDLNKLAMLTSIAFSQRRKMLRNSLGDLFSVQQLATYGIDAMLRAENLSVEHYCRLANALAERHFS